MSVWIERAERNPRAHLRLFCLPYAGGGTSMFRTWSATLPDDVELWLIRLPGREDSLMERPFKSMGPLVEALAQAFSLYLDMPFAFFGHSMGALISFELAHQIKRQHQLQPVLLLISGCRAPQVPSPYPPIYLLPDWMFLAELRRRYGSMNLMFHDELTKLMLPTIRADIMLCETYVPSFEGILDCAISAFGGMHDYSVAYQHLAAWKAQSKGDFIVRMLPGDHFFLHTSQALLVAISHDLRQQLRQMHGGGE